MTCLSLLGILYSWEFSGEPGHVHFGLCASSLCGVPGRYEYIWSFCWSGCRAGTGFLSFWLCSGVCLCDSTGGGVAGQYNFSSILLLFWGVRYD